LNFFAHVCVVCQFSRDDAVAFGAMLPDFASLLGFKTPPTTHRGIALGCELHHLTDAEFHNLRAFRDACHSETTELRQLGFARGPASALAHVGLEFLLDNALFDVAPTHALVHSSLLAATPDGLGRHLEWGLPEHAERFENLRQRLVSMGPPNGRVEPGVLAERLTRTLRHRPRLAVSPSQQEMLVTWVRSTQGRRKDLFPKLFEQVLQALRTKRVDLVTPPESIPDISDVSDGH
jgi:hypothetical protein